VEQQTGRNTLCACGSGRRYKHCHGAANRAVPGSLPGERAASREASVRDDALAAHRAGSLGLAEKLYRQALAANPADVDVLHMLGVVMLQRLRHREALELLLDAAERTGWAIPEIRHNLALVVDKLNAHETSARHTALTAMSAAHARRCEARCDDSDPLVSAVVWAGADAGNGVQFTVGVERSLASVAAQSYRHLELIVAGCASDKVVSNAIASRSAGAALPFRVLADGGANAARTLNGAVAAARGTWIAFLRAGDVQAPERIEALVDAVARRGARWGFSLVAGDRDPREPESILAPRAIDVTTRQRIALGTPPASFAFIESNAAMVPGNLFVERTLFDELGGFRDLHRRWDHDFCLRATSLAEPAVVQRSLYIASSAVIDAVLRGHGEDDAAAASRVMTDFLAVAFTAVDAANPLAPADPANRTALLRAVCRANLGALIPPGELRALALEARARKPRGAGGNARIRTDAPGGATGRTAIVILGMHRSGTSAVTRVLNLCGAYLPADVKPANLRVNAKGFWESEAVLDLDSRLLRQLGGEWNRIDFVLPESGAAIDEFLCDASELIATEYATASTILVKDPRIGVIAPLWQRVFDDAGFRTAWVVPVRNPLEVARSLHARGDMGVREGLALWLAYMRRIREFGRGRDDVVWITYDELLADWRAVVARIARRLGVELDASVRADEIERFLDRDLRHHVVAGETLDSLPGDTLTEEVRTMYRECLDAYVADLRDDLVTAPRTIDPAGLTFVLCIENNELREQALLLCESLRRYGGRQRDARVVAFAPRPGLGVGRETRARLADLAVDYVDEPLNTACLAYGPANRIYAGARAEAQLDSEWIAVLDSDTLVLDEIELPVAHDAAVRPVDEKGSATRGPDDPFEPYWERMAELAGIGLGRLPRVRTTITGEPIRASYNGGFAVVRRSAGILRRCARIFTASLERGWRPYAGAGIDVHASTGSVGRDGSEFWGSSQTALALAIWASTDRVRHLPDRYNVPLHLIAAAGEIDPRWLAAPPAHVHYHWMFDAKSHEIALELLARLGVATDALRWLEARLPFPAG
jgi:hypothetical protein